MKRRLIPLVMALSIAAAPLAVAWCQITCAETAAAAMPHSCHHHSSAGSGASQASAGQPTQVAGVPHACGHEEDVPVSATALETFTAPATLTQALALWQPVVTAVTIAVTPGARAPIPPLLHPPLRV